MREKEGEAGVDEPVTSGRRPSGCLKLVGWFLRMHEEAEA